MTGASPASRRTRIGGSFLKPCPRPAKRLKMGAVGSLANVPRREEGNSRYAAMRGGHGYPDPVDFRVIRFDARPEVSVEWTEQSRGKSARLRRGLLRPLFRRLRRSRSRYVPRMVIAVVAGQRHREHDDREPHPATRE